MSPTVPQRWKGYVERFERWLNPPWRRHRPPEARAWAWAALGTAFTCYLLAFLYLGPAAGTAITMLYALPCVIAGWAFGASGGVLVAMLTTPIHAWLFASGVVPPVAHGAMPALLGLAAAILVGGSVGSARELRERLAERTAELAASEDRYRQLVDNSPEGVLVHERGVILFANPSLARLVHANGPEALVGHTLASLAPFEDREALDVGFVFPPPPGRRPRHVEARLLRGDEEAVEVLMTSMPIDYRGRRASLVLVREKALAAPAQRLVNPAPARRAVLG